MEHFGTVCHTLSVACHITGIKSTLSEVFFLKLKNCRGRFGRLKCGFFFTARTITMAEVFFFLIFPNISVCISFGLVFFCHILDRAHKLAHKHTLETRECVRPLFLLTHSSWPQGVEVLLPRLTRPMQTHDNLRPHINTHAQTHTHWQ